MATAGTRYEDWPPLLLTVEGAALEVGGVGVNEAADVPAAADTAEVAELTITTEEETGCTTAVVLEAAITMLVVEAPTLVVEAATLVVEAATLVVAAITALVVVVTAGTALETAATVELATVCPGQKSAIH